MFVQHLQQHAVSTKKENPADLAEVCEVLFHLLNHAPAFREAPLCLHVPLLNPTETSTALLSKMILMTDACK